MNLRLGVAAKLAICVIASTAAFFALFGFINLRMERTNSRHLVWESADRLTDVILRSARYAMLHNDRAALSNILLNLGNDPGTRHVRIIGMDGRVALSSDWREAGRLVRRPAPGEFHEKGEHLLRVTRPIENSVECSNAACHVHSAENKVLGVIDADLSLATVDAQLAQHQATLAYFLAAAILFGSGLAVVFIWFVVYRPVKALIDGTHRVANGDLAYRLPVPSEDELGDLAASFNKMTEEVSGVQSRIEAEVRRQTAELERAHKTLLRTEKMASIGKLAATVAHEINNPLFGILTYARLVLRELLKHDIPHRDDMAEQLQIIERESRRCGDLVKNLLTFSRQAPAHREPGDLNAVVQRSVALVKHKLQMQKIDLEEELAQDLPPVSCDANQIQQVLVVLLVNASEAMPNGGRVAVATAYDPAAEMCSVRVRDFGCGIPEDVLPRIFDPFFTTKEDQNRTGLGLAVAHSIVEQHAGEISVRSTPGEGTEFCVTLPAGCSLSTAVSQTATAGGARPLGG